MKQKKKLSILFFSIIFTFILLFPFTSVSQVSAASSTTPAKVTLRSLNASAYNKVTVKWKAASNATSYNVYYKESGAAKWTKIKNISSSKTSYTHISSAAYPLTPGKTYYYTVRGYNSSSKKSGSYNTTGIKVTIPGKPSKVTVSSVTATAANKVQIKWNTATDCTEYRIYYKTQNASSWTMIGKVSSSNTSYTHTSSTSYPLKAGTTYSYRVRAYNSTSKAFSSYASKSIVMPGKPGKVTLKSVSSATSDKVTIKWKAASNVTSYSIYYKKIGASTWTKITSVSSSKTSYTHTSSKSFPLKSGDTYAYTVRGYNSTLKLLGSYDTTGLYVTIPIDADAMAKEVFRLTNIERAKVGLEPLIYSEEVQEAAMLRAKEISTFFSHTRPDGSSCDTVFNDFKLTCFSGENIAAGQTSPKQVMTSWMNSQGHKENILYPDHKYMGVGFYQSSDGFCFWVQNFAYENPTLKVTITFDANGGSKTRSYTLPYGDVLYFDTVPAPTRKGYTFIGWVDEDGFGDADYAGIRCYFPHTFYAQWKKNS